MTTSSPEPQNRAPEPEGQATAGIANTAAVGGLFPELVLALNTFLGAFLLFFLEPLIARFLLPWFGGSAGVWTTCLLFFQICLLAGYAYAHGLARWLSPKTQAVVHVALLAAALLALPVAPGADWKPAPEASPVLHLLLLLTVCIGLPFLALSATGPLMQAWFSRLRPGRSPYRLYALSNAGSLLALLSYPFVFEPWLPRLTQAALWSFGFGLFALSITVSAVAVWRSSARRDRAAEVLVEPPMPATREPVVGRRLLWLLLPACASLLLMAVTNKLCQDVAVIPFLWVLPLSLYLLSFMLCFDSPQWYERRIFQLALVIGLPVLAYGMVAFESLPWLLQIGLYGGGLFVACMICHGELYRLRPAPSELTGFYLMIAAGGALGGGFVAVGAPILFSSYAELHVGLLLLAVLLLSIHWSEKLVLNRKGRPVLVWPLTLGVTLLLVAFLGYESWRERFRAAERHRNFYGVLRVLESQPENPFFHMFTLMSGGTMHGRQYQHPVKATWPTSYYHPDSGIGLALNHFSKPDHRRIGVVGLGVGTVAAYGRSGDVLKFYEINPYVETLARTRFTYLAQTAAKVEVVLGDARLSLEREPPQNFDLLVLDAFSSDAIPVHLLTREAFEIYLRHLQPDGLLVVHLSNRHLDLRPVVEKLAEVWKLPTAYIESGRAPDRPEATPSHWMLLTRNPTLLANPKLRFADAETDRPPSPAALWTDEYTSLFKVLKQGGVSQ